MDKLRINFLMPCYAWAPSGGFRVVYEYANQLASRGHQVAVIHPRRLEEVKTNPSTMRQWIRKKRTWLQELVFTPGIEWQRIDPRVRLLFVPSSNARHIPDGDVLFATGWHTVPSVLTCSPEKGEQCYMIQHYEVWQGPKGVVDAGWRSQLHKVVVSKWLLQVGRDLGCEHLVYIPNAIDLNKFHLTAPIEGRAPHVAMLFADGSIKGVAEGIEALVVAKQTFPDLRATLFGVPRRRSWIPKWIEYYCNPPQEFLVNEIYNKAAVFLSPSWSEGFALPPAEAAACGSAVVATDSGGIRDYIEHGVTGLLSAPKDARALGENLCMLLANEHFRVRLAKACKEVVSEFSWVRNADLMEKFLGEVASHDQGASSVSV